MAVQPQGDWRSAAPDSAVILKAPFNVEGGTLTGYAAIASGVHRHRRQAFSAIRGTATRPRRAP